MTPLQAANAALREQRYEDAIRGYIRILVTSPALGQFIHANLQLARRRYRAARQQAERPRVQVCGCDLAENAAGRAHTLAQLYEPLAEVSILGGLFPHPGGAGLWPPLSSSRIPILAFPVDGKDFSDLALEQILNQPADQVHLSKPRMPNILLGILYKLIWGTRVLVDIDDEELAFVKAETPLYLGDYLHRHGRLPPLDQLLRGDWTRLGVGLAAAFDGITVSNPALQQRYGGVIIRHARDEQQFTPTPDRRHDSRLRLDLGPDQQVVLFLGTPRKHKGLLETAQALARLRRPNLVFLIIGSFSAADQELKKAILAVKGLDVRLLDDQPFDSIPDLLACGDICILLQNPDSPIANFQVPAKLTDALAMGLQVLAEPTPALADLGARGAFTPVSRDTLHQALKATLDKIPPFPRSHPLFHELLSITTNQPQMQALLHHPAPSDVDLSPALQRWCAQRAFIPLLRDLLSSLPRHRMGVSIVILTLDAAPLLDRLLSSFLATNTHQPCELIVIDHGAQDKDTSAVIARHQARGDIWHINRHRNFSFSASGNFAAGLARYPHLLFLNNDIVYTNDVLTPALQRLADPRVGAVGVRLDDDPSLLPPGQKSSVQHTGIHFVWNDKRGYRQPEQIRYPSLAAYLAQHPAHTLPDGTLTAESHPAVTGAFLLCRQCDFQALGGFSQDYDYGLEDIDFCLRLSRDLDKTCCCLTGISLQHSEGTTRRGRKYQATLDRNHQYFKERWGAWIETHSDQSWGQYLPLPERTPAKDTHSVLPTSSLPVNTNRKTPANASSTRPRVAVAVHIYYPELWPEIGARLRALDYPFDLFITTTDNLGDAVVASVRRDFSQARISINPNQGMDILPFIRLIPQLVREGYPAVCKLHTKKDDGERATIWRQVMLDALIGDPASFAAVAQAFGDNADLVLAGPASLYQSTTRLMLDNQPAVSALLDQLGIIVPPTTDWGFFAGTAFWVRPSILAPVAARLIENPTALLDSSQRDGQGVHAMERIFGLLPGLAQQRIGLLHPAAPAASGFRLQLAQSVGPAAATFGQASIGDLMRQYARLAVDLETLRTAAAFDADHYLLQTPQIAGLDIDLPTHYLLIGRFQGLSPHPDQSPGWPPPSQGKPAEPRKLNWRRLLLGEGREASRPFSPLLVPLNQVAASKEVADEWHSTGEDPQFQLRFHPDGVPKPGWFRIDLLIEIPCQAQTAKFYLDEGGGYSEARVLNLPTRNRQPVSAIIEISTGTVGIRLDPMEREGPFRLFVLRFLPLSEREAIDQMLAFIAASQPKATTPAQQRNLLKRRARRHGRTLAREVLLQYQDRQSSSAGKISYQDWIKTVELPSLPSPTEVQAQLARFTKPPLISVVVPVYNTPEPYLRACLDSVLAQSYPHWELCIADDASTAPHVRQILEDYRLRDPRIRIDYRRENGHISQASNSALAIARGDYVAFLDHDDALPQHALYFMAMATAEHPAAKVIYSDEDKLSPEGERTQPHFKSDWNPDLFFSQNYVCHLAVFQRDLLTMIGGFRTGVEGSQDHDLLLRCLPHLRGGNIHHIPRILYHWRSIPGSTADSAKAKIYTTKAGIKALEDYFATHGPTGIQVEPGLIANTYHILWPIPNPPPLVSLLIPTRDKPKLIETAVHSILDKTTYHNYEILILDNGSIDPATLNFFNRIQTQDHRVRVLRYDQPFNFSAINNYGVKHAKGEIIGFINNDIEVVNPNWLSEMVMHACRQDIGCVGAKLYYYDGKIQHAGVILGIGGVANHAHLGYDRNNNGYFGRLITTQNLSAVTAACLIVRQNIFEQVGGFDAENLAIAFNDVDFCLKVLKAGFRNLWTPFAELYHQESASRGTEDTTEKQIRFWKEVDYMKNMWGNLLTHDPYYNRNLNKFIPDFSLIHS